MTKVETILSNTTAPGNAHDILGPIWFLKNDVERKQKVKLIFLLLLASRKMKWRETLEEKSMENQVSLGNFIALPKT